MKPILNEYLITRILDEANLVLDIDAQEWLQSFPYHARHKVRMTTDKLLVSIHIYALNRIDESFHCVDVHMRVAEAF